MLLPPPGMMPRSGLMAYALMPVEAAEFRIVQDGKSSNRCEPSLSLSTDGFCKGIRAADTFDT